MHLICLVIAGQRVHDQIDPEPVRHLPLTLAAWDHGKHRHGKLIDRPGRCPAMAADDHRGHAIIDAGFRPVDPNRPSSPSAGKILQQIEGTGQRVVFRHRFQWRQVDAIQQLPKPLLACPWASLSRDQITGIAGIEQDHPALTEIGVDTIAYLDGDIGMISRDRPIEQREKIQIIPHQINGKRRAGLDRGSAIEH